MQNYITLFKEAENLYCNKKFADALELFLKLYNVNPSNTNANYIACCYIGQKQYDKAEKLLTSLIKTTHWEPIHYNLARVYMCQKRFKKSLQCLKEAVEINPQNDDCYFYLGVLYEKTGDYIKAIEYYNYAEKLCDNAEDASMYLNNVGLCYYKMDNFTDALHYYNLALEKDSKNHDAKHNIMLISSEKKEKNNE